MKFLTDSDTHRAQTILAILQLGVVFAGSMLVGGALKVMGYEEGQAIATHLLFVRNWGFLLAFVPLVWVALTILLENTDLMFSKRHTMVSGSVLLLILFIYMTWMVGRAVSSLTHVF